MRDNKWFYAAMGSIVMFTIGCASTPEGRVLRARMAWTAAKIAAEAELDRGRQELEVCIKRLSAGQHPDDCPSNLEDANRLVSVFDIADRKIIDIDERFAQGIYDETDTTEVLGLALVDIAEVVGELRRAGVI